MKIKDFLTQDNWIKGDEAVNGFDAWVEPNSAEAVKWCLSGALERCYENNLPTLHTKLMQSICEVIHQREPEDLDTMYPKEAIVRFNDDPFTKFEDIQKVLKHADI
jgi:hypothetical protein